MNIPSSDPVDPEGVDGNIHTNGLEHIRCIDCESEQNEWSRDREIRVCEEPRKETDYVKDRPSATSDMIPRPRPGDTFNDPPDPGSWARAERRQCQGATTIQLLPLQLYGTEKYGPALLEPLEREQVRSVVWALLLPAQKVKSSHALLQLVGPSSPQCLLMSTLKPIIKLAAPVRQPSRVVRTP